MHFYKLQINETHATFLGQQMIIIIFIYINAAYNLCHSMTMHYENKWEE